MTPEAADRPLVLVVDDFLDAREMYAEYFAFSGFRVVEASNGAEAVQKALELTPQVILMDLSMCSFVLARERGVSTHWSTASCVKDCANTKTIRQCRRCSRLSP